MAAEKKYQTEIEAIVCHECVTENDPTSHFCNACGTPLSSHAATDPIMQVYATGRLFSKASGRPTRFIVLLGMWMIFGPMVLIALHMIFSIISNSSQIVGTDAGIALLAIVLTLALVAVYVAILHRVTQNYKKDGRRIRLAEQGLCPNCSYDLCGTIGRDSCPECGRKLNWDGEFIVVEVDE